MRIFITVIVTFFMIFPHVNAQEKRMIKPLPLEEIQKVASQAFKSFSRLVTDKNYEAMGFESPGEVQVASLDEHMRVFTVRLDELKKYTPGSDPNKILSGGDQVIYPITVEKQIRSSIVVGKMKEKWTAVSFGGSNQIKMLTKMRKDMSESIGLPISSYFVVQVPALNLHFIAHQADEVLMLTPLLDDPSYGFKAGATIPAKKVFEIILPAAKAHDGLPR